MDWNERQRIAKAINDNIKSQGGKPPIRMGEKKFLDADLENFFDWADRDDPEIWDDFPPHVREWHRQRKATKGRGYVKHFRDFTPRLAKLKKKAGKKLTVNSLMMFLVYRDSANDSDKVNGLGLRPGETCIGGKAMAKKAGVPVSRISEGNKILQEAGLVVYVRRLWEKGLTCGWWTWAGRGRTMDFPERRTNDLVYRFPIKRVGEPLYRFPIKSLFIGFL